MADTYTLAELMESQTLGGQPALPNVTPRDMRQPQLAQHNMLSRFLGSFGQPSLEALQRGYQGEATPQEVAWSYLTEGPFGPFGAVNAPSRMATARKALNYHYRDHVNEYGEPLSASHLAHLGTMGAMGYGVHQGAAAIGFGDPVINAGAIALGMFSPHIRHTAQIYRRLRRQGHTPPPGGAP